MAKTVQRSNMTQTVNGIVTREPRDLDDSQVGRFYWWKKTEDEHSMAQEIGATVKFIQNHQSNRVEQLTVSTRLYGQTSPYNLVGTAFTRANSVTSQPQSQRLSYNLCASVVDTLTAQIAKNKVIPTFITSGATWGMQKKAEQLSRFASGLFYEQKVNVKKVYMFRDGAIWGDGILSVFRTEDNRVGIERVLPHELLVDVVEASVTDPKQLHRVKIVDRNVLATMFPDLAEEIMKAQPTTPQDLGIDKTAADLITVVESWHLKSGLDAEDGLHVISLPDSNQILFKEEYDKDYFPFVIFQYNKRPIGYWGQGVCERLQNLQGEINRTMITIQKCHWLFAGTKVYLPNGSKVATQHINNEPGAIIQGDAPPQYMTPPALQAEMYQWVETLKSYGYQQEGISEMQSASLIPQGVKSGAAMRTYDQIAENRQLFIGQRMEEAELEIIRQAIEVVRDIYKDTGSYKVQYPDSNFIETIDWADVNLERDEYYLKAFPTSELPEEPAARLETIQEYMAAGLFSPRVGKRLMMTEDIQMQVELDDAAEELIFKTIEEILYEGKKCTGPRRPTGEWDLQAAAQIALQYLAFAQVKNCPPARIQELRKFKAYVDEALQLLVPPQPPVQQVQPGVSMPQANPAPTPVSNAVPNVNTVTQ